VDVLAEVLPLALLDTLSVSTLAVPLWFLLTPRGLRVRNVLAYLAIVAMGYLLLGCALLAGLSALRDDLRAAVESPVGEGRRRGSRSGAHPDRPLGRAAQA